MRRTFLTAVLVSAALPAAAHASFTPPQEVAAPGRFHREFMAASDATGRLTVATRSAFDAPRLIERPAPGGAWADLPPIAGIAPRSFLFASSMAAAGGGALPVAWALARRARGRVDPGRPRRRLHRRRGPAARRDAVAAGRACRPGGPWRRPSGDRGR